MNNEQKVYQTTKKYVKKDGTIVYYPDTRTYIPVSKEQKRKPGKKVEENSVKDVASQLSSLKQEDLIKVKQYILEIKSTY